LILYSLALAVPAAAQDSDGYPFTHLEIEHEPLERQVVSVAQDSQGFIWFGGQDGLSRYDGYEIKTFQNDLEDPLSISSNRINEIFLDSQGVLWIGTHDGLNRYDAATETFQRFLTDPQDPTSLSNDQVEAIAEDASGDLWIGTTGGLNRFERQTAAFTRFLHDPADPSSLASNQVYALVPVKDGTLWVGTYGGGLDAFDPATGQAIHYQHQPDEPGSLSSNLVYVLLEDRQGNLWVGTWDGGLNRLDRAAGSFASYRHDPADPYSLGDDGVTALYEDQQGALWVGTRNGGLNRLDQPETRRFTRFQKNEDPDSLSNNYIFDLYQDSQGLLWIATIEGLGYYDPFRKPFQNFTFQPSNPNSLSDPKVLGVIRDSSGVIWTGTPAGLDRIEGDTITHFRHDPENPESMGDNLAYALAEDPSGALWVGTWKGLDRLDPATGVFTHFPHDPDDPSSLSENTVYALHIDPQGILWVGTFGGLNRFDRETGTFTRYLHDPADPDSLGANPVFALASDASGTLWVGTDGGGLNRLDPQTGAFQRFLHDPKDPDSLSTDSINSIYADPAGDLWLGTSNGLNRFSPRSGIFRLYSSKDGLPSGAVNQILPDTQGRLWLSTDHGLVRFDPQGGEVTTYDHSDGLVSDDFERKASFRDPGGELFFGTNKGLIVFDPAAIEQNPFVPPVHITGLELENQPVRIGPGSVLEKSALQTEAVELSYLNRVLTFEFSALNYRAPQENRYRYMLEGFDTGWTEVGSDKRRVTYTNLDPKSYVFRVLGSNDDGIWNETGASIRVRILPPWWESGWFYLGIIGLVAGMFAIAHQTRIKGIERRNKWLEQAVTERTVELEETNLLLEEEITAHKQVAEELRISEASYRTIFDTTGTAMVISTPDKIIRLANQKYAQLTGYSKEALEGGMKWTEFLHPGDAERVIAYSNLRWQDPASVPRDYELRFVDREGQVRHILTTVALIPGTGSVVASLLEITARKELELSLERQRDQLSILLAISQNLVSTLDLDPLLSLILDQLYTVIPYEAAAILGIDRGRVEPLLIRNPQLEGVLKELRFNSTKNPVLNLLSGSGEILYIEDTHAAESLELLLDGSLEGWRHSLAAYRTWLFLPLVVKGELMGCLVLTHSQPDCFDSTERSLAQGVANQAGIAMVNARLHRQAQEAAVASERLRLARDLHDSVAQALYTINLFGEASRMAYSAGKEDLVIKNLNEIQAIAREATTDLRVLIYELHPPVLFEIGLAAALKNRIEAVEMRAGIEAGLIVEGDRELPPDVQTDLFRIAQEALTNVLKHAQASRVQINLYLGTDRVRLIIQDNGIGFFLQEAEAGPGVGLRSLRERVQRIGGTLRIETAPGQGTKLVVEL
jgi:PAS domain S-box-containing protein